MEISNSRRWMGLIPIVSIVLCFLLSACNSTEEPFQAQSSTVGDVIHLSNGETIILSDTTTYVINPEDVFENTTDNNTVNLFNGTTRSSNALRALGFDRQEPETDWKKYYLTSSWEEYGVTPATYVGRYVKVHKNLSIEKGTYAVAADYTSDKVPDDVKMGWEGNSRIIGFTPTTISDYISDGVTRIFIINCDLSGRVYNKNIPNNPDEFVWVYKMESKADIWD